MDEQTVGLSSYSGSSQTPDQNQWRFELNEAIEAMFTKCRVCEGYYGPNFSEPVCSTCHMFLFKPPELIDISLDHVLNQPKNDERDSGNEEPDSPSELDAPIEPRERLPPPDLGNVLTHHENTWRGRLLQRVHELSDLHRAKINSRNEEAIDSIGIMNLPIEVLLQIFSHLSDVDLQSAAEVHSKWAELIDLEISDEQWEEYVKTRWPLFKPFYRVESWRDVHTQLLGSVPCKACLHNMNLEISRPIVDNTWRGLRLNRELASFRTDPPEGIVVTPLDTKSSRWQATITGPKGSPYEGGLFFLYLQVPRSYPINPPYVQFITKLFHPNVSFHGNIGLDIFTENWCLTLTLSKILLSIQSLLTDPYLKVSMEPAVASCYRLDRALFTKIAKTWTQRYAMAGKHHVHLGKMDKTQGFLPLMSVSI